MGPSGSGKTTLLDLFADRQARYTGKLECEILLNDFPVKQYGSVRKRLFGYVTQEDGALAPLTVAYMIHAVMQELNLTHIKDTKVGGAIVRGISGGEKRRVFIGIELLSSPSVLLLDEPTSGLSSTDALNVANAIKDLSTKGRTVILAVHQPRSDIYELFDDLLLLSQGKVVYFGKAQSAASYFENLGHECPVNWNLLKENENNPEKTGGEAHLSKFKKEYTTEYATTAFNQTLLITQRSMTNWARHPLIFQAAAAVHILFALVVGSLFSGLKGSPELGGISLNKSISLFFISSFLGTITSAAMSQFIIKRSVFLRERAAGMYRTSSYFMAKTIVETLSHTILSVVFVVIIYYLIGLSGSLIYYFILTTVFVNVALSLIAAIGAHVMNTEVGMIVLALISCMAMLFSGFLVKRTDIPCGWIWAFWASHYQWAFSGMLDNEFSDGSPEGIATLTYFGMYQVKWLTKWSAVLILLGYNIVLRFIGFLLLLRKKA
ncbi:hypothetical protein BGX26_005922 [Mortierella sp. AD094]|nr:hypothetical protein BGX26_005922 [Mortierella sp. AD094]